jgi:hypothetical protein
MFYYKIGTIPLEAVEEEGVKDRQAVYNEFGKLMQKFTAGEKEYMVELLDSVLNEGELLRDLTIPQLELFWVLSKNKRIKYRIG